MKIFSFALVATCLAPWSALADFDASVAALKKGGLVSVSVVYSSQPNLSSALDFSNFSISPTDAVLESVRYSPGSQASILTVSGLLPEGQFEVSVDGVSSADGSELIHRSYRLAWPDASEAEIGAGELGFRSEAVALGQDAYDLISGSFEFGGVYDEATFVYQPASGDFDKVARVEFQENSSPYARAGLMVREAVDASKARPSDENDLDQAFSRFVNLYVSPLAGVDQTVGNPFYTSDVRLFTGGIGRISSDATSSFVFDAVPGSERTYPEAWVRIKRSGDSFKLFKSGDGKAWTELSTMEFPLVDANSKAVPPFSTNALIGLFYSADNGNIPFNGGLRGSYKARFTDFSGFVKEGQPPRAAVLTARRSGDEVVVSWTNGGTLLTAPTASGPWTELLGKPSPQRFDLAPAGRFFQVRNP